MESFWRGANIRPSFRQHFSPQKISALLFLLSSELHKDATCLSAIWGRCDVRLWLARRTWARATGTGRGFRPSCFLCGNLFIRHSNLINHIALHHVFFNGPPLVVSMASQQVVSCACGCWDQPTRNPYVYKHCHIVVRKLWVKGITA